jgi:Rrf2 family protein
MATLFRFSEAAALALHAMVYVACQDGEVVKAREMSAAFKASDAHMSKVCQRLTRSGLLKAHRGARGGFTLGRSARAIRLLAIYSAIEGPVTLTSCLFKNRSCRETPKHDCLFGKEILRLEEEFLRYLQATPLSAVAAVSDLRKPN